MLLRKLENVKIEFKSSISNIFQVKPLAVVARQPDSLPSRDQLASHT